MRYRQYFIISHTQYLRFITKLMKSTKQKYSHLQTVYNSLKLCSVLRQRIFVSSPFKHEIGVVCIQMLIFRFVCRVWMYRGQLLVLYNCMIFVMREIRTFLRQYKKSVNEHQSGDCFMFILFRRFS